MPHGGYRDCKVEEIYAELDTIIDTAKERNGESLFWVVGTRRLENNYLTKQGAAVCNQGTGS